MIAYRVRKLKVLEEGIAWEEADMQVCNIALQKIMCVGWHGGSGGNFSCSKRVKYNSNRINSQGWQIKEKGY